MKHRQDQLAQVLAPAFLIIVALLIVGVVVLYLFV